MDATSRHEPIILIENYDLAKGDKFLVKRITKPGTWMIQIIGTLVGVLDGTVKIMNSNTIAGKSETDFQDYPGLSEVVMSTSTVNITFEDAYTAGGYLAVKLKKNTVTSSSLKVILSFKPVNY